MAEEYYEEFQELPTTDSEEYEEFQELPTTDPYTGLTDEQANNLMKNNILPANLQLPAGVDWSGILKKFGPTALATGLQLSGLLNNNQQKSGYQGGISSLTANRQQLPINYNADRVPGSMGRRYFTDTVYTPKAPPPAAPAPVVPAPEAPSQENPVIPFAQGGMIGYAQGGIANLGYYLGGATDGMADKIPATIAGKQKAALSHGEFVIPADIVSALGSGNSSAGAKVLYGMMDRVRQHAHGTKKQIKPANLKKTLPA